MQNSQQNARAEWRITLKLPYCIKTMFFQHLKIEDVMLHISRVKNRKYMITSIDRVKAFNKIQQAFTTKIMKKPQR
jgi:hypothetical protein